MGVLFVPILSAGIVMMIKSPELLKKRLNAKEKRGEQSIIVKLSGLMFIAGFVIAGLDYRFGWFPLPLPVVIMGDGFGKGVSREGGSILDIAPTVADIVGVAPNPAWEGKELQ